jgi:hypothetical protein
MAFEGHVDLINLLLAMGAKINAKSNHVPPAAPQPPTAGGLAALCTRV